MKKNTERIFNIAIVCSLVISAIFLGICIFTRLENNMNLVIALGASWLGNILNLIKSNFKKKN